MEDLHKLHKHGSQLFEEGKYMEAESVLKEVVNKNPVVPMPEEVRKHLEERYKEDIVELSKRFGARAMSWWPGVIHG